MITMKLQQNVETWERLVSVALGAALGAYGVRQRRVSFVVAGTALATRGVSGYCPVNQALGRRVHQTDTREALGGSRGVKIEESVTIRRNANELYDLWRPLSDLPTLLPHIERVDVLGDNRSHWVMRGPVGMRFEWDAELINDVRPDLIAWRSLPGADIATAGSVRFRERECRSGPMTELTVTLQYEPVGGKAAAVLAWISGQSPSSMLREDLRRFKARLEADAKSQSRPQRSLTGTLTTAVGTDRA